MNAFAVGEHRIINPYTQNGCLRVPAAGAGGADYLVTLASTTVNAGISGAYLLRGSNPGAAAVATDLSPRLLQEPARRAGRRRDIQGEFDVTLRNLERQLADDPRYLAAPAVEGPGFAPPPDTKTFKVCSNLSCSAFTDVAATRRYLGTHAAIYLDDEIGAGEALQQADFDELGGAFDNRHYPIATAAFGAESDIDDNGVVMILMTDQVNALTPDCENGRVVGYFFGGDLLTGPNSNLGEVFYTLVPRSTPTGCAIGRSTVVNNLKPTLIHELQHMISFNQHRLVRNSSSEVVWLNEALSHFAEELGGRLIPDAECQPDYSNCRTQYSAGNIFNAYDFMKSPRDHFLVFSSGNGTLEERGAGWLFLRWVLDQYTTDPEHTGIPLARNLVETNQTGVVNIQNKTGASWSTLIPQWLLTLYLDDLSGFPQANPLQLESWGLRAIFTDPQNQGPDLFNGFPLVPPVTGGSFTQSGTLRTGTGAYVILRQNASGPAIDLQVVKNAAGNQLDQVLVARYGIVRIR